MKNFRGFALVAGLVLTGVPVFGQSALIQQPAPAESAAPAIPADQQATREQVEKMFEVLRLRKQMETTMNMMPRIIEQSFEAEVKNVNAKLPPGKRMGPQDRARLEKVMSKYVQQALSAYPIDQMIADAIPIYQRHISTTDADAVIAFYSSPAGQRLLDEQPAIQREYMGVVMSNMETRSKRLTEAMEADIQQMVKPQSEGNGAYIPRSN